MTTSLILADVPEDDLSEVLQQEIDTCQRDVQARIDARNKYEVDSRQRLDNILAQVLDFGQRWLSRDAWHLNDAYRSRDIMPTEVGGNHYLQLIYLLTGRNDAVKTVKWEGQAVPKFHKGTKLAKYAGALRLMDEEGVQPSEVHAYIGDFENKHPGYGARLNGMINLDRERNGGSSRDMFSNDADALDQAAHNAIMASAVMDDGEKEEELAKPRKFALAWGVLVDGKFYPGGPLEKSEARAKTAALKTVEAK